jgi:hypothetical protein
MDPMPQDRRHGRHHRTAREAADTAAFFGNVRAALAIDAAEHAGAGLGGRDAMPSESPRPTGTPGSPVAAVTHAVGAAP